VYVIVDDKLPTMKDFDEDYNQFDKLCFACCNNKTEFWVPLIEKAYAKLHINY
jgi:Calpain family cysteine protease